MAHMSSETYRTPYLDKEALLGLERMKFLNRAIHRLQTTDEKVKEHAKNRVATIYGNMALSSNPLTFENIEFIFDQDRAPSGISLSKVLEVLSLRRLHGEISERITLND